MIRLFVRHNVADYEAWRHVYDEFDAERRPMGVTGDAVFRSLDDSNDVTLWHDFDTAEAARAFVSSDALRNAMQRAGVQGEPRSGLSPPASGASPETPAFRIEPLVEFRELLPRRRMVRHYRTDAVPREVLERITNAAVVRAPSAGFSQGLRLVVVTDPETRRRIAVAAAEEELAAHGRPRWKAAAPVHVVVLTREDDYHERCRRPDKLKITGGTEIEWPAPYWFVDAGAAMMVLMLAAIDEGLATAVFGVTDLPALREALQLPDDLRFVAVVTMGYPSGKPFPERETSAFRERRRPRSEVVRWERW